MSRYLTAENFRSNLQEIAKFLTKGPLLIHSDISKIGLIGPRMPPQNLATVYLNELNEGFFHRCWLIPTFNYDFCKTGIYDRHQSRCMVGSLGELFRKFYPHQRTRAPIFNFFVSTPSEFDMNESSNTFGYGSGFSQVYEASGMVMFLGIDFTVNTFLHFIEERQEIGYRYPKQFKGHIIDGESRTNAAVSYRVRPLDLDYDSRSLGLYDWNRLIKDLKQQGILQSHPIGLGEAQFFDARTLTDYWGSILTKDEFYLLSDEVKHNIDQLAKVHGYPFHQLQFEGSFL